MNIKLKLRSIQWNGSKTASNCSLNSWLVVSQWAAPGSLAPPTLTHQHFFTCCPLFYFFFEKADWKLPSYRGQRGRGQPLLLPVKTAAASPHCYCWTHSNNTGVYTVVVVVTAAAATAVTLWTAAAAGGGDTVRVYSSRDTEGGGMDGSADSIETAWKHESLGEERRGEGGREVLVEEWRGRKRGPAGGEGGREEERSWRRRGEGGREELVVAGRKQVEQIRWRLPAALPDPLTCYWWLTTQLH